MQLGQGVTPVAFGRTRRTCLSFCFPTTQGRDGNAQFFSRLTDTDFHAGFIYRKAELSR